MGRLARAVCKCDHRLAQLPSFQLRNTQRGNVICLFQMRNRLCRIALSQQGIAQQLVSGSQVRAQVSVPVARAESLRHSHLFPGMPGPDRAKPMAAVGSSSVTFWNSTIATAKCPLLLRLRASLQVLSTSGDDDLPDEEEEYESVNHGFSGSTTSRNWSA